MHKRSTKFRCPIQSSLPAIAAVFAHFYSNRIVIPGPIEISMFTLLYSRQVLYDNVLLNGEVPCQIPNAISISSFRSPQFSFFKCPRMIPSVPSIILCRMNCDVTRLHCPLIFSAIPALGYEPFHYLDFTIKMNW